MVMEFLEIASGRPSARALGNERHVRDTAPFAFGIGDDGDISECNHGISDSSVESPFLRLKSAFGFNGFDDVCTLSAARPNPFRSNGVEAPRTRITRADAEEPTQNYATHVVRAALRSILAWVATQTHHSC